MTTTPPERPRKSEAEILARFRAKGPPPGVSRLLGLELTAIDHDNSRIEASFRAGPELCNPIGTVQGGILTAKALMKEGGVIACEAGRHPFPAMHPEVRRGLIDIARRLDPLVLRWGK